MIAPFGIISWSDDCCLHPLLYSRDHALGCTTLAIKDVRGFGRQVDTDVGTVRITNSSFPDSNAITRARRQGVATRGSVAVSSIRPIVYMNANFNGKVELA